jgi:hypothetical protein
MEPLGSALRFGNGEKRKVIEGQEIKEAIKEYSAVVGLYDESILIFCSRVGVLCFSVVVPQTRKAFYSPLQPKTMSSRDHYRGERRETTDRDRNYDDERDRRYRDREDRDGKSSSDRRRDDEGHDRSKGRDDRYEDRSRGDRSEKERARSPYRERERNRDDEKRRSAPEDDRDRRRHR